jgi:hypothetical protein
VVHSITLDDFVTTSPAPHFIKMDIEGAELAALEGARRVLSGVNPPKILIEFHSEALRRDGCAMLGELGYRFYSLGGDVLDDRFSERHILCVPRQADCGGT